MKMKLIMLIITLLLLSARLARLDVPPFRYFDEYYSAYSAVRWVAGDRSFYDWQRPLPNLDEGAYVSFHPPGGVFLTALGVLALGDNPYGWRIMSALAGLVLITGTALVARYLSPDPMLPLITAFLISVENLSFFHSRVGTIDIFLAAAVVLATWFSLAWRNKPTSTRLLLIGLSWGLALSVKWSAGIPWIIILLFLSARREAWRKLIIGMVLFPLAVYLLVFALFLPDGLQGIASIHQTIIRFHFNHFDGGTYAYNLNRQLARQWWEWPFVYRPVRYFFQAVLTKQGAFQATVNVVPNLPVTFVLPLAVGAALIRPGPLKVLGIKPDVLRILALLFFSQWLIWFVSPRPTYLYYFLPAIPFGTIALAAWLGWLWRRGKRVLVTAYLFLAFGFFALHYPWLTAVPVPLRFWG